MFGELQGLQNHDFGQSLDNVAMQLAVWVSYPLSIGEGREVRVPQHSYPNSDKHATTVAGWSFKTMARGWRRGSE